MFKIINYKMNNDNLVELLLNRKKYDDLINISFSPAKQEKILITGGDGSIGIALEKRLKKCDNLEILTSDIVGNHEYLDVTDFQNCYSVINKFKPTIIINLAGAKHAPLGEKEIWKTLSINTIGTKNLLDASPEDCKFILASTCKANNPEVVYGASKLIAEKICINRGGTVVRFFNVIETAGNVFEIWNETPKNLPIKVMEKCERHFITLDESIGLIIYSLTSEPGRYIINSLNKINIGDIADKLYPDREKEIVKPRIGDRLIELEKSTSELFENYILNDSVIKLSNIHD